MIQFIELGNRCPQESECKEMHGMFKIGDGPLTYKVENLDRHLSLRMKFSIFLSGRWVHSGTMRNDLIAVDQNNTEATDVHVYYQFSYSVDLQRGSKLHLVMPGWSRTGAAAVTMTSCGAAAFNVTDSSSQPFKITLELKAGFLPAGTLCKMYFPNMINPDTSVPSDSTVIQHEVDALHSSMPPKPVGKTPEISVGFLTHDSISFSNVRASEESNITYAFRYNSNSPLAVGSSITLALPGWILSSEITTWTLCDESAAEFVGAFSDEILKFVLVNETLQVPISCHIVVSGFRNPINGSYQNAPGIRRSFLNVSGAVLIPPGKVRESMAITIPQIIQDSLVFNTTIPGVSFVAAKYTFEYTRKLLESDFIELSLPYWNGIPTPLVSSCGSIITVTNRGQGANFKIIVSGLNLAASTLCVLNLENITNPDQLVPPNFDKVKCAVKNSSEAYVVPPTRVTRVQSISGGTVKYGGKIHFNQPRTANNVVVTYTFQYSKPLKKET